MSNKAMETAKERHKQADLQAMARRDSHSRVPNKAYRDNYDRIFKKKDK